LNKEETRKDLERKSSREKQPKYLYKESETGPKLYISE